MRNDERRDSDNYVYSEVQQEMEEAKSNGIEDKRDTYTYSEALELTGVVHVVGRQSHTRPHDRKFDAQQANNASNSLKSLTSLFKYLQTSFTSLGNGRYNYMLLTTCSLITNACALDMFGYATVVAAASCDLNVDLNQLGLLAAAPFAGVLFAFPWGYYADTRGRKRAMLLSTSIGFFFAVISAFSTHWLFMMFVKIICSSFSTASFTLSMALLGECTGNKHRSQYLFIMNSLNLSSDVFAFGLAWLILPLNFKVSLPLLNMTFRPWRLYTIALAVPLGIGAVLLLYLYESPEFLACKGDYVRASEVLLRIYERNGGRKEDYPVKQITPVGLKVSSRRASFWKTFKKQTLPIFQPPLIWRTIQLFFLLSLCCMTNNVFTMWYPTIVNFFFKSFNSSNSTQQSFCQRVFGDPNLLNNTQTLECQDEISLNTIYAGIVFGVFYLIMSVAVIKISSRPRMLLVAVLLVSGVSELLVNVKNPIANMVFFTLLQDTSLGVGCISSYFVNLYPALHRGQVTSLGMMVARLCSLTGVSLVGAAISKNCEATFYTWSAFIFGGVIVCLFLPADRKKQKPTMNDSPT